MAIAEKEITHKSDAADSDPDDTCPYCGEPMTEDTCKDCANEPHKMLNGMCVDCGY